MRAIRYYVVYEIWEDGNVIGKATSEMLMKRKVRERKDIEDMEAAIEKDKGLPEGSNAVIVNYILMDDGVEVEAKSEADDMFKELGYDLEKEDWEECVYRDSGNEDLYIRFDKRYEVIMGSPTYDYFCDMPLLVAINEKCKELGWM